MKAEKLPSGAYRYRVYYYDADGKRHARSFTDPDRDTAKRLAKQFDGEYTHPVSAGTFGSLLTAYIEARTPHLSPSTIRGYNNINKRLRNDYSAFYGTSLSAIRKEDIQGVIDSLVKSGASPKTIRNIYGMISAVAKEYDLPIGKITMPAKTARDITVPEERTVRSVLKAAKDTKLEIPIMLAAFGGLRRGEICALRLSDIDFNTGIIHVCRDVVSGPDKKWHIKPPKTRASDRYIQFPEESIRIIKDKGSITDLNPHELTCRFNRFVTKHLPKKDRFRFHDLRHFCASYMHSKGIPDAYIMQRCGWENDDVLKAVYRHTLQDQNEKFTKKINRDFCRFL